MGKKEIDDVRLKDKKALNAAIAQNKGEWSCWLMNDFSTFDLMYLSLKLSLSLLVAETMASKLQEMSRDSPTLQSFKGHTTNLLDLLFDYVSLNP